MTTKPVPTKPALRKVRAFSNADGSRRAVVFRDAEWGEFRVSFAKNGSEKPRADYHTDDRTDALGTAEHFCKVLA